MTRASVMSLILILACNADQGAESPNGSGGDVHPLLLALDDRTGCVVRCDGPPPGPECVVYCEQAVAESGGGTWEPKRCEKPHYHGDVGDFPEQTSGDPDCWAPPASWCANGSGAAITVACTPDGQSCCAFGGTCIPCGWQYCQDEGASAECAEIAGLTGDLSALETCPEGLPGQQECILCGETLVCPDKAGD